MSNITINYKKSTIEITKSFEKQASVYGSQAYNELREARAEFPTYRLVIKANKSSSAFKGMDYDFMLAYIKTHENEENTRETEFGKLRASGLTYGEVKQWFVSTYPAFKDCKTKAQWVLAA
jgi:hypothetical protein